MKLSEIDRLKLKAADLELKLIGKAISELANQSEQVKSLGNEVIARFCKKNKLDINKISIDPNTGEVTVIKDKEVEDAEHV